jgi:hypothetical protein
MKTISINQKVGDLDQSPHRRISAYPFSFYCNDGAHNAKAGTTNRTGIRTKFGSAEIGFIPGLVYIVPVMLCKHCITSFEGEPAHRMCIMPKESKSLSLHHFQ